MINMFWSKKKKLKEEAGELKEETEKLKEIGEEDIDEEIKNIEKEEEKAEKDIKKGNLKDAEKEEKKISSEIKNNVQEEIDYVSSIVKEIEGFWDRFFDKAMEKGLLNLSSLNEIHEKKDRCIMLLNNAQNSIDDDIKISEESVGEAKMIALGIFNKMKEILDG